MKLVTAQVRLFRNILDSTPVPIQPDITCFVGKNESGKTAFLHALYRLMPARPNAILDVPKQYPAWREKKDRQAMDLEEVRPVTAVFELEPVDTTAIIEHFGSNVLKSNTLELSRAYSNKSFYALKTDEAQAVQNVLADVKIPQASLSKDAKSRKTFTELANLAAAWKKSGADRPAEVAAGTALEAKIKEKLSGKTFAEVVWSLLSDRVPQFFYFGDYSKLPYSVKIRELLAKKPENMTDDEATARSLLGLAGAEKDYLLNTDYERRKRELENVANQITADVLQYWSQNPTLRVQPDITQVTQATPQGQQSVLDELKIRIWDDRHWLTLPFNEHSTGFQWFFSFLAAFSEFEDHETPVVILLDEPALGLHARAQADFLRFIQERLAEVNQVIYTTHSPFMIQPGHLERVRMVEDKGRDVGTTVTKEILSTDPDTLFPLQGALGYDLAQHLFIGPHNLVVEGTSDFTFLTVMSDFLKGKERTHLDAKWSIVPVGGADMVPSFVALLGNHLDVTVLIDSRREGNQRLSGLAASGYLDKKRLITIGDILGRKTGDVEDVFSVEDYLSLYNTAFSATLTTSDLTGEDAIVSRIARHLGVDRFDHGKPADALLRKREQLLDGFSAETLSAFEKLFAAINKTLFP